MGELITFDFRKPAKTKPIPQTVTDGDLQWLIAAANEYKRLANLYPEESPLRQIFTQGWLGAASTALDTAQIMGFKV
ncbi:hypothetical protein [Methylomagnum sp.]